VQYAQANTDEDVPFPNKELPILKKIQRYRMNDNIIDLHTIRNLMWIPVVNRFERHPEQ
jgi:hypothetical protein